MDGKVVGTPIGLKREQHEMRSAFSRRESDISDYSCAYELDLDGLEESDLVKLKLPELPTHVREAFRKTASGDADEVEKCLEQDPNLVYAMNQGGSSLLEVARERGLWPAPLAI